MEVWDEKEKEDEKKNRKRSEEGVESGMDPRRPFVCSGILDDYIYLTTIGKIL